MAVTKEQKAQAQEVFERNPEIDVLHMNPKGEFFTVKEMAELSLSIKNGKRVGKIEEIKRATKSSK